MWNRKYYVMDSKNSHTPTETIKICALSMDTQDYHVPINHKSLFIND